MARVFMPTMAFGLGGNQIMTFRIEINSKVDFSNVTSYAIGHNCITFVEMFENTPEELDKYLKRCEAYANQKVNIQHQDLNGNILTSTTIDLKEEIYKCIQESGRYMVTHTTYERGEI